MRTEGSVAVSLIATSSQTVGPFFHFGLAANTTLGKIAAADAKGERIGMRVQVLDGDYLPVPDALIEIYQADADGQYGRPEFPGFGRLATDENGGCVFDTIRPGAVSDGRGGVQAPHLNVCVFARGLLRQVYTRIYFSGDDRLPADPILGLVPPERRQTLEARPVDGAPAAWEFTIQLQGERETVFFDL
jgi:protocatechuate 3,4-dioxygenase, alpha subunit